MEHVLLTPTEIADILDGDINNADEIAKAQLKNTVEWMVKNHIRDRWCEETDTKWQALLKEAGLEE